jgi:hypothetical protein
MGRVSKVQRIHSLIAAGALAACLALSLTGCSTYATRSVSESTVALNLSQKEIPESELVDVRIEIFDPGSLPESEDLARGLSDEIRKAEAHFIPAHLKTTLQRSGYWGAVRVVPASTMGAEVVVTGKIVESDGEILTLEIGARDARGVQWFQKTFEQVADSSGYTRTANNGDEVFQSLYNEIANEIALHMDRLSPRERKAIRQTAELRFANELAPSVFSGYLFGGKPAPGASAGAGQDIASLFASFQPEPTAPKEYQVVRLPAHDDPMISRVRRIRGRDYLLVDTLDEQYDGVYKDMKDPYTAWRESRLNEINTIREVDRKANEKAAIGVATIVIGILAGAAINNNSSSNNNVGSSVAGSIAATAASIGVQQLAAASSTREEASLNLAAMTESGESFAANVEPFITEVEGETVQLTGTAAGKYAQWRDVLKRIHEREMGLPEARANQL